MNTPGKIKMPRKSSKNEAVDWTDHVFEFRKGGITYEVRHRVYTDQSDGKKKNQQLLYCHQRRNKGPRRRRISSLFGWKTIQGLIQANLNFPLSQKTKVRKLTNRNS